MYDPLVASRLKAKYSMPCLLLRFSEFVFQKQVQFSGLFSSGLAGSGGYKRSVRVHLAQTGVGEADRSCRSSFFAPASDSFSHRMSYPLLIPMQLPA